MNIYTLHQAGSFRPPSNEYDAEIENVQREKLPRPNIAVVTDENKLNHSTSQTSETRGSEHSSSVGERTTPRHNVTPTFTNNFANNVTQGSPAPSPAPAPAPPPRVSASRIDATGVITGMNKPQVLSSKVASNNHPMAKKKMRNMAYSSAKMTKHQHRHIGLIHIQAKDEFMVFEDNTDLVSHITTPSAVRTSPLETDYLVIDHDEFADEQSLFSAITVPKALRKKKNKKSKKSSKDDTIGEEEAVKIAASTSVEESEDEHEQKEPRQTSPPKHMRQNSLENFKNSGHSQSVSEKNGSETRGGKRDSKVESEAEKTATPPKTSEEADDSSQGDSKNPSPSSEEKPVDNNTKSKEVTDEKDPQKQEEGPEEIVVEDKTTKVTQSILKMEKHPATIAATSKASTKASNPKSLASTGNVESAKTSPQKRLPQRQTSSSSSEKHSEIRSKSPESVTLNPQASSAEKGIAQKVVTKTSTKPNRYKFTVNEPLYSLDVTNATAIDSTARTSNDGSNKEGSDHEELIHEEPIQEMDDYRKVPNSHKRSKSFKASWLLPTTYFCCEKSKKEQVQAVEESMRRTPSR
uniref:Uncharacterized protein n=1 Tax=Pseudo-nitzschia arenysensis TaxID=697910 RepID=A0A7R9ZU50_9STRA|mmetsp:Transcript_595/g.1408  ORF Transcript_595/g.1408 Transcript_595/m.1408 type:complete len:578 (+) Transcript_595:169-1902(+)|eukprot:CAMPEP_0116132930 /NCGR_PEP_ID=MMETSP0329-20121206/9824_1 /TAXON_ID=697910 /ORGANISM="Pseudo-nitzschia arenysensis, Strain B593" /LENGTH=577 /DNA_ID=CAMNT_0003627505 /DNA_START=80 /DNA_END=1813 /DNA_ORIENTATION=+